MKILITPLEGSTISVELPDERRTLQHFLAILDAPAIAELEIHDFKEDKLPRNLSKFSTLKTLRFVRCHALTQMAPEIAKCTALRELAWIKCADFHDLRGIHACPNLEILHVSGCDAIDTLPADLHNLTSLKALDLSYSSGLEWLELAHLPESLRILDIHGCWRADFDDSYAQNMSLVSLQIQDASRLNALELDPHLPNIATRLRRTLSMRDSCALDGD